MNCICNQSTFKIYVIAGSIPLFTLPEVDFIIASHSFSFIFLSSSISCRIFSRSDLSSFSYFSSLFNSVTALPDEILREYEESDGALEIVSNCFFSGRGSAVSLCSSYYSSNSASSSRTLSSFSIYLSSS